MAYPYVVKFDRGGQRSIWPLETAHLELYDVDDRITLLRQAHDEQIRMYLKSKRAVGAREHMLVQNAEAEAMMKLHELYASKFEDLLTERENIAEPHVRVYRDGNQAYLKKGDISLQNLLNISQSDFGNPDIVELPPPVQHLDPLLVGHKSDAFAIAANRYTDDDREQLKRLHYRLYTRAKYGVDPLPDRLAVQHTDSTGTQKWHVAGKISTGNVYHVQESNATLFIITLGAFPSVKTGMGNLYKHTGTHPLRGTWNYAGTTIKLAPAPSGVWDPAPFNAKKIIWISDTVRAFPNMPYAPWVYRNVLSPTTQLPRLNLFDHGCKGFVDGISDTISVISAFGNPMPVPTETPPHMPSDNPAPSQTPRTIMRAKRNYNQNQATHSFLPAKRHKGPVGPGVGFPVGPGVGFPVRPGVGLPVGPGTLEYVAKCGSGSSDTIIDMSSSNGWAIGVRGSPFLEAVEHWVRELCGSHGLQSLDFLGYHFGVLCQDSDNMQETSTAWVQKSLLPEMPDYPEHYPEISKKLHKDLFATQKVCVRGCNRYAVTTVCEIPARLCQTAELDSAVEFLLLQLCQNGCEFMQELDSRISTASSDRKAVAKEMWNLGATSAETKLNMAHSMLSNSSDATETWTDKGTFSHIQERFDTIIRTWAQDILYKDYPAGV